MTARCKRKEPEMGQVRRRNQALARRSSACEHGRQTPNSQPILAQFPRRLGVGQASVVGSWKLARSIVSPYALQAHSGVRRTRYSGWQIQQNAKTVQGELARAIGDATARGFRAVRVGRTDAGVHALAQVAHLTRERRCRPDLAAPHQRRITSRYNVLSIEPVRHDSTRVTAPWRGVTSTKSRGAGLPSPRRSSGGSRTSSTSSGCVRPHNASSAFTTSERFG